MAMTPQDLLAAARGVVPEVTPAEAADRARREANVKFIDVRDDNEWAKGHIPDALHITRGMLEFKIGNLVPDRAVPLVLY